MNEFATWLRSELAARDWDQADLWRRAGISQSAISHVLSGDRKPGERLCHGIARAFGIPAEEVMRHAGILPPTKPKTERIARIIAIIEELSEDEQDFLEDWARLRIQHQQRKGRRREAATKEATTTQR